MRRLKIFWSFFNFRLGAILWKISTFKQGHWLYLDFLIFFIGTGMINWKYFCDVRASFMMFSWFTKFRVEEIWEKLAVFKDQYLVYFFSIGKCFCDLLGRKHYRNSFGSWWLPVFETFAAIDLPLQPLSPLFCCPSSLCFYHRDSAYFRTSCCCVHRKKTTGRSLRTLRARQAAAPQYEFVQRFHVRMLWTLYQCQPSQVEDVGCHFRRITPGDSGSDMYHIRGY